MKRAVLAGLVVVAAACSSSGSIGARSSQRYDVRTLQGSDGRTLATASADVMTLRLRSPQNGSRPLAPSAVVSVHQDDKHKYSIEVSRIPVLSENERDLIASSGEIEVYADLGRAASCIARYRAATYAERDTLSLCRLDTVPLLRFRSRILSVDSGTDGTAVESGDDAGSGERIAIFLQLPELDTLRSLAPTGANVVVAEDGFAFGDLSGLQSALRRDASEPIVESWGYSEHMQQAFLAAITGPALPTIVTPTSPTPTSTSRRS